MPNEIFHKPDGKFKAGNPGGGGNQYHTKIATLRSALFDAVGYTEIKAVINSMLQKAQGGDVKAAQLLLGYVLGKPEQLLTVQAVQSLTPEQQRERIFSALGIVQNPPTIEVLDPAPAALPAPIDVEEIEKPQVDVPEAPEVS